MFTIDYDGTFQGMIAIKPSGLKSWEGSITFAVCTVGFVLGLPIATEVLCMDLNMCICNCYCSCYCCILSLLSLHVLECVVDERRCWLVHWSKLDDELQDQYEIDINGPKWC